eukprot:gene5091-34890_t
MANPSILKPPGPPHLETTAKSETLTAVNSPKAPPETGVHVLDGSPAVVDSRCAKLTVAGFEVEGVSIAGQETCIIVPRAKVAFDIGRCPQRAVFQQTLLISHGHLDHIGGVPFHVASRAMQGLSPSKVVVPPSYKDGLERYIGIADELQGNRPTEYEVLPLKPGEEIMLPSGFIARPFPTTHTIASQGYLLYSMRKKLKAELVGQSQDQIRELRSTGAEVTDCVRVPEVAFTGDTTAEFLENPEVPDDVFKARLLIMEPAAVWGPRGATGTCTCALGAMLPRS